ncbi:MAG: hypothetical protein ABSA93_29110 [Streptosporangiaceae bacterium]
MYEHEAGLRELLTQLRRGVDRNPRTLDDDGLAEDLAEEGEQGPKMVGGGAHGPRNYLGGKQIEQRVWIVTEHWQHAVANPGYLSAGGVKTADTIRIAELRGLQSSANEFVNKRSPLREQSPHLAAIDRRKPGTQHSFYSDEHFADAEHVWVLVKDS